MTSRFFTATLLAVLALPALTANDAPSLPATPSEIIAGAPASDWKTIAPDDLMIIDLAPDAQGRPRQVVIQLMPAPFSQGHVGNIRKLIAARWFDGIAIVRVQDNYVVQWGDPEGETPKPQPRGLATIPESAYAETLTPALGARIADSVAVRDRWLDLNRLPTSLNRDAYADETLVFEGWPVATDGAAVWPVHCYGMVGVGRNVSPDTGTGAELYAVIGHAPRHLDRNIALAGRVIAGIEHLSSLPRGTGPLGFYESAPERVTIRSVRLASDFAQDARPNFEMLDSSSESFARYAFARANRKDDFFIRPAGGADICNIPVPIRPVARSQP